ncbi:amidohydrolase family protein [Simiduia agarivorans]|uniref:Amidohydrolase n=1 Tax=Simiduia agarivorans (strain DSM 21679 / JCM 13881 / BCRC 17597 / SA1) TaxID=1117647 RepID=K4KJG5_SIMAS|nr:amidohydrolase family protein [Simiduia agarivorans]AFU98350.1 amidohydrolase [Simiduia agarivorans SA1 = DSM 21679]
MALAFRTLCITLCGLIVAPLIVATLTLVAARWYYPDDLPAVAPAADYVIDKVHIVDVAAGRLVRDQQLLIRQGRIAAIAPAGTPHGADIARRDGQGAFVLPGLTDMHVHVYDRKELVLNLTYGVTRVRNLRGMPMHLRWRQELQQGRWLGASLVTASPALDGPDYAHALQEVITTPAQARARVERYQREGWDLIKAYGYLAPDVLAALVARAAELGLPVAKHAPHNGEGDLSPLQGLQSLEHVEDIFQGPLNYTFDDARLANFIGTLRQVDSYVTPTLATFNHLTLLSEHKQAFVAGLPTRFLNPFFTWLNYEFASKRWLQADQAQAEWNRREHDYLLHITRQLHLAGIRLLVGSDAGTFYMVAGDSTHREMRLLQTAGLPPAAVLRAATLTPAQALGIDADYGLVAAGKVADLVLTRANPLADVAALDQITAVIKGGQWLGQYELSALRASAEKTAPWWVGAGNLLDDLTQRGWRR